MEKMIAMRSHIPHRGEQMLLYYGYDSNASRGNRRRKVRMTPFQAFSNLPTPDFR
jgi:hypothetical protein